MLLRNAHLGYIGWERFGANRRRLRSNALAHGADRRRGPPREGPALLQGLVVCGVCGQSMTVRYHSRRGRQVPDYVCQREGIRTASAKCQSIPGAGIDRAVGEILDCYSIRSPKRDHHLSRLKAAEHILTVAEQWKHRSLLGEQSLFTKRPLWTRVTGF